MAKEIKIEDKKCLTPEFRVSFPSMFEAKAFGDGKPSFGLTMLFEKNADLTKLKTVIKNAAVEKWGEAKAGQMIEKYRKIPKCWPFKDGNLKEDLMGYKGTIYIPAKSKDKPGLVNGKREAILDPSEFYAGCYARATVIAYVYDNDFGIGFGFSLQNVQKTKDGKPFSGRKNAEDEFDEVEDSSDDADSYDSDQGF